MKRINTAAVLFSNNWGVPHLYGVVMDNKLTASEEIKELIKRRRHQILVHSYIYFRLSDSIISNDTFDKWANELIELQTKYPKLSAEVDLYDMFKSFSSISCSSSLPLDNEKLANRAHHLLKEHYRKQCD